MKHAVRPSVLSYQAPTPLPARLEAALQAELQSDEQLLWTARPNLIAFALRALPVFVFGILVIAFGLAWRAGTRDVAGLEFPGFRGAVVFFQVMGVAIPMVGGVLLLAPVAFALRAARTCYAVTHRRAIILMRFALGGTSVASYGPAQLSGMTRRQFSDRRGDLVFEEESVRFRRYAGRPRRRGFLAIDHPAAVEDLIRHTLTRGEGIAREG
jgi:hypothetical protein